MLLHVRRFLMMNPNLTVVTRWSMDLGWNSSSISVCTPRSSIYSCQGGCNFESWYTTRTFWALECCQSLCYYYGSRPLWCDLSFIYRYGWVPSFGCPSFWGNFSWSSGFGGWPSTATGFQMNLLSWNCQGLGNPLTIQALKAMIALMWRTLSASREASLCFGMTLLKFLLFIWMISLLISLPVILELLSLRISLACMLPHHINSVKSSGILSELYMLPIIYLGSVLVTLMISFLPGRRWVRDLVQSPWRGWSCKGEVRSGVLFSGLADVFPFCRSLCFTSCGLGSLPFAVASASPISLLPKLQAVALRLSSWSRKRFSNSHQRLSHLHSQSGFLLSAISICGQSGFSTFSTAMSAGGNSWNK